MCQFPSVSTLAKSGTIYFFCSKIPPPRPECASTIALSLEFQSNLVCHYLQIKRNSFTSHFAKFSANSNCSNCCGFPRSKIYRNENYAVKRKRLRATVLIAALIIAIIEVKNAVLIQSRRRSLAIQRAARGAGCDVNWGNGEEALCGMAGALVVQLFDSMLYSEAGRRGERSGCRSRCRAGPNMCSPRRLATERIHCVLHSCHRRVFCVASFSFDSHFSGISFFVFMLFFN